HMKKDIACLPYLLNKVWRSVFVPQRDKNTTYPHFLRRCRLPYLIVRRLRERRAKKNRACVKIT
ncbi:MAG TPA: hypothetical protein VF355_02125, partial [Anaerolineaceae bacterium]